MMSSETLAPVSLTCRPAPELSTFPKGWNLIERRKSQIDGVIEFPLGSIRSNPEPVTQSVPISKRNLHRERETLDERDRKRAWSRMGRQTERGTWSGTEVDARCRGSIYPSGGFYLSSAFTRAAMKLLNALPTPERKCAISGVARFGRFCKPICSA